MFTESPRSDEHHAGPVWQGRARLVGVTGRPQAGTLFLFANRLCFEPVGGEAVDVALASIVRTAEQLVAGATVVEVIASQRYRFQTDRGWAARIEWARRRCRGAA